MLRRIVQTNVTALCLYRCLLLNTVVMHNHARYFHTNYAWYVHTTTRGTFIQPRARLSHNHTRYFHITTRVSSTQPRATLPHTTTHSISMYFHTTTRGTSMQPRAFFFSHNHKLYVYVSEPGVGEHGGADGPTTDPRHADLHRHARRPHHRRHVTDHLPQRRYHCAQGACDQSM